MTRWLAYLLAAMSLASCQAREYERKDYAEMNAVALKSVCVGRLEIDLPASGSLEWRATLDQTEIVRMRQAVQNQEQFWVEVDNRAKELESRPHNTEESLLYRHQRFDDNAAIILYREDESQTEILRLERYLWLGRQGYKFNPRLLFDEQVDAGLESYRHILTQLVPHDAGGRPEASGFCIDGATVTGDWSEIMATIRTRPRHWASGELSISVGEDHAAAAADDADAGEERFQIGAYHDLERDEEEYRLLRSDSDFGTRPDTIKAFEVMRKREREALDRPGKEAVWKKIANSGAVIYEFRWYNEDASGSKEKPGLSFDMRVGDLRAPDEEVPSEEEMFGLWDAVLESLSLR